MSQKKIWALLTVAFLLAGTGVWAAQTKAPSKPAPAKEAGKAVTEKPKEHQATGTVVSSSASSLTISKGKGKVKAEWTFVVTPKTKIKGTVAKDAKVTVHYHEDKGDKVADRINVHEAKAEGKAPEGKAPAKSKASKSKS